MKKGMHSKQEIEPGNTTMTGPEPNEEQVTFPINSDGYLAGGIELHARIVEVAGGRGLTSSASQLSTTGKFRTR